MGVFIFSECITLVTLTLMLAEFFFLICLLFINSSFISLIYGLHTNFFSMKM